jgi:hypothetical protein
LAVHVRGNAVNGADKRTATAADHSVTNFSAHNFLVITVKEIETGCSAFILSALRQVNGV